MKKIITICFIVFFCRIIYLLICVHRDARFLEYGGKVVPSDVGSVYNFPLFSVYPVDMPAELCDFRLVLMGSVTVTWAV